MKLKLISIMSIILFTSLCVSCEKSNENNTGLEFSLNEEQTGYYVSNGTNAKKHVNIPDSYNNLPVVGIADKGFYDLSFLKEVKMPDSIKEIGESAFESCENLKKVCFSNSLEKIDTLAFRYCEKLKKIQLPDSVKEIHLQAFAFCDSLSDLSLSSGLEYVSKDIVLYEHANKDLYKEYKGNAYLGSKENPYMLLAHCVDKNNKNFIVHEDCKYISANSNYNIRTITLGDKVEIFNMSVGNKNLHHVYGNPKLKYIGNATFSYCENLLTFPSLQYAKYIGHSAFSYSKIPHKDLHLENIEFLGEKAFLQSKNIKTIILGNKLTTIPFRCLYRANIDYLYIPKSVQVIECEAFFQSYSNEDLERIYLTIYYEGTRWQFESIVWPDTKWDYMVNDDKIFYKTDLDTFISNIY